MGVGKLGWREMRRRPLRAALTLTSVVIGVAAVVAVSFATQSTRHAFNDIFQALAGKAALEIAAPVGRTVDERLLAKVAQAPGVAAASPLIQRHTIAYVAGKRVQLVAMGIDPVLDKAVHDYEIVEGKPFTEAKGVLLSAAFAKTLGVKVGDELNLLARSGRVRTHIVGTYKTKGTASTAQGASLLMSLRDGQTWFRAIRQVDAIQIVLKPDATERQVQAELEELLPPGPLVRRPAARSAMAEETALATDQALGMARSFSLLVAVFVITNTFLISVTQRRRQFGIMRAIGATRAQIARMVFGQALMLGAAGTVLGCLVGVLAARVLNQAMGSLYETTLPPIALTPSPFLWGALFGIGISLAGAALPARKATHLSPLDALRDVLPAEMEGFSGWLIGAGAALVVICGCVLTASILGRIGPEQAVWSAVVMLVGLVLLLPLALGPFSRGVAKLLSPWMRVEARLAGRHLLTHRSRTTLTVGVVFIAAAAAIGLANTVLDNVQDVKDWYHKSIIADYFVRATMPDMATGMAADLPDELGEKLAKIPGITSMDALRLVSAKVAGQPVVLIIRAFDKPELQQFDLVSGDPPEVRRRLQEGEVVVGSVFAQRAKLKAGDEVRLDDDKTKHAFRIAAVTNDYQAGGLTMYLDRKVAETVMHVSGVDAYAIKADHARLAEVRSALEKVCEPYGIIVQSFTEIQREIDAMMAGVDAGLWGMVVLGLVVAMFGVANTLTMSVLEQTFELGLLRIIATTQAQVRKMVFAQALIIGLLALAPGIIAGVGVGYLIHLATMPVIGHPVDFVFHPWLLAGSLIGGLAVVVASAWPPANSAATIELSQALRLR